MSYFSSVAGFSVVRGSLLIPQVGMWTADLYLATDQAVAGVVPVVVGNLTLSGFSFRSNTYGGQTRVRMVGGKGGWRNSIGAQGYGASTGVRLSTVLNDAANACGETVNVAADRIIGNAYARPADIASDMLWQLVSQGIIPAWYVDPNGTTQVQAWPTTTVTSPFTVTDQKPDQGIAVIATEDYASWLPGCQFTSPLIDGTFTNMGVHYLWPGSGDFRLEVMTGADNLTASFDAIVQKNVAPTRFHGRYKYTVTNPNASTIDCDPVNESIGLPNLQNVPLRGDSVSSYIPPSGSECHIMFLDGVPTQPICVWTAGNATSVQIGGGNTPIALEGSEVTISVIQWNAATPTAPSSGGAVTISNPMKATITGGSGQVSSQ